MTSASTLPMTLPFTCMVENSFMMSMLIWMPAYSFSWLGVFHCRADVGRS